jgi:hypothetical protein
MDMRYNIATFSYYFNHSICKVPWVTSTLLGQNVNSYGKDIKDLEYGLGDLLEDISKIDIPRV